MKWVCLHGFAGSGDQFSFINEDQKIIFPIEDHIDKSVAEIYTKIKEIINEPTGLIGYSFGARLAAQIFLSEPSAFKKLILMAGHLGLSDELERKKRLKIEQSFMHKIKTLNKTQFETYWNGLELFAFDRPVTLPHYDQDILNKYFTCWGLSKQPYLKEKLVPFKDKVSLFYGDKDSKYKAYAQSELSDFDVTIVQDTGHRIYQSPEFTKLWSSYND